MHVSETGGVLEYMQNGKKPTREQKKLLTENKLDPKNWLYIKDAKTSLVFRDRSTGEEIALDKNA